MLLLAGASCKKEAGEGGLATITGKVYATDISSSGVLKAEGYLGEARVYISVAGETAFFEDTRTSYDGSYRFDFLRKGSYDIWTYSDCDTCQWAQKYQIQSVTIDDKRETVTVPDLHIIF